MPPRLRFIRLDKVSCFIWGSGRVNVCVQFLFRSTFKHSSALCSCSFAMGGRPSSFTVSQVCGFVISYRRVSLWIGIWDVDMHPYILFWEDFLSPFGSTAFISALLLPACKVQIQVVWRQSFMRLGLWLAMPLDLVKAPQQIKATLRRLEQVQGSGQNTARSLIKDESSEGTLSAHKAGLMLRSIQRGAV